LFNQAGYEISDIQGIPAPFPLAIGNNWLSRSLLKINQYLIRVRAEIFSYQIFLIVSPLPTLEDILRSGHLVLGLDNKSDPDNIP